LLAAEFPSARFGVGAALDSQSIIWLEGSLGGEKREILKNKDQRNGTKTAPRRSKSKASDTVAKTIEFAVLQLL
jgi:hypothetical protein